MTKSLIHSELKLKVFKISFATIALLCSYSPAHAQSKNNSNPTVSKNAPEHAVIKSEEPTTQEVSTKNSIKNSAQNSTIDRVVAIVDNEPVLLSDLSKTRNQIKSESGFDDLVFPDEASRKRALQDESFLIDRLIQSRLVDSEIKRSDIKVTDDMVEQQVRDVAKQNKLSRDQLKQVVENQGMSFEDYLSMTKKSIERRAFIEKTINSRMRISEDEVAHYILSNYKDIPDSILENQVARILISTKKRTPSEALSRAQTVFVKIKAGESFEALAADYSEDTDFSTGGILGTFKTGELSDTFEKALKPLAVGETSPPFLTDDGYQLLKVVSRKLIPDPRFEQKRGEARAKIGALAFKRQFESWIEQKKKTSFVRINSK